MHRAVVLALGEHAQRLDRTPAPTPRLASAPPSTRRRRACTKGRRDRRSPRRAATSRAAPPSPARRSSARSGSRSAPGRYSAVAGSTCWFWMRPHCRPMTSASSASVSSSTSPPDSDDVGARRRCRACAPSCRAIVDRDVDRRRRHVQPLGAALRRARARSGCSFCDALTAPASSSARAAERHSRTVASSASFTGRSRSSVRRAAGRRRRRRPRPRAPAPRAPPAAAPRSAGSRNRRIAHVRLCLLLLDPAPA